MSVESTGTFPVKRGLAEMMKGGVIMDVVNPEQAKIAEDAGAVAVMALERVPADIRRDGGVARMSDPEMIIGIQEVCSIPVMAKARIGHFVEAQILQSLGVDFIDDRRRKLEEYLTAVVAIPGAAATPFLRNFLQPPLRADWPGRYGTIDLGVSGTEGSTGHAGPRC